MNSFRPRKRLSLIVEALEDRRMLSQGVQATAWASAPASHGSQAEIGSPSGGGSAMTGSNGVSQGQAAGATQSGGTNSSTQSGCSQAPGASQNGSGHSGNAPVAQGFSGGSLGGPNGGNAGGSPTQNGGGSASNNPRGAHVDGFSPGGFAPLQRDGRGPGGDGSQQAPTGAVLGWNPSPSTDSGPAADRTGGDAAGNSAVEAAGAVALDVGAAGSVREPVASVLVTLTVVPESFFSAPSRVTTAADNAARGQSAVPPRMAAALGDREMPEEQLPTASASSSSEPGGVERSGVPENPANILGNGLDLSDPQAADLITGFLPFSAESLEHAINQFLDPIEGMGGGMPELVETSNLGPATWAVAVTVVALDVAIRIKRSRREGTKDHGNEPGPRFPGLPGHWRLSRS